jgi:hypothetical protein
VHASARQVQDCAGCTSTAVNDTIDRIVTLKTRYPHLEAE